MKKIKVIITVLILIVLLGLTGFIGYGYYKKKTLNVQNPVVTMEVENFGTIKLELYPDQAPNTVANFVKLANNGYYNGLTFHRIVKDFMIQGGDSEGTGKGSVKLSAIDTSIEKDSDKDKEYNIKGEFIANKVNNTLKHEEGVISMARADYSQYSASLAEASYNSAGSQFFIVTKATKSLDGQYAAFGKVTEGLDIVHKIENVKVKAEQEGGEASIPVEPVKIKEVKVETFGIDYGMPKTQDAFNIMNQFQSMY